MSTAPSNSASIIQTVPKTMSPLKKSNNLKQTTLVLSAAMLGDNTKCQLLMCIFRGRANHKRKKLPMSKGKEMKGLTLKAGPSRDTTL